MKNCVIILLALFALSSCNEAEIKKINVQKDSLNTVIGDKDSTINEALDVFLEIEKNLNEITVKEKVIVLNTTHGRDMPQSSKERINMQIATINNLMERNRTLITNLNKKVKDSGIKNASLLKTIVALNNRLVEKDMELKKLGEELQETNTKVTVLETISEDLKVQNNQNAESIAELTGSLHTAYYIVGEPKWLEELNIIDKKGGILGLGKTKQLKEDFNKASFTQIDYTTVLSIAVYGKNANIISNHPKDSYYMEQDLNRKDYTTNLIITDAEKFWSVSKYLVITKKNSN